MHGGFGNGTTRLGDVPDVAGSIARLPCGLPLAWQSTYCTRVGMCPNCHTWENACQLLNPHMSMASSGTLVHSPTEASSVAMPLQLPLARCAPQAIKRVASFNSIRCYGKSGFGTSRWRARVACAGAERGGSGRGGGHCVR